MKALRRYRTFLLLIVAGTVAFAFFFNTWVNPWRTTPSPWTSKTLDEHRAIDNAWNRTSKAGLVRSGTWDAAIFGSSRVDIALNPEHPFFGNHRCVNLGLNAANIVENHAMFRYFVDHQEPSLIVFALDSGDLTSPPHTRNLTDFPLSPLAKGVDPLERELRYRVGISTLQSSLETVQRSFAEQAAEHSPTGFRYQAPFPEHQRAIIGNLYTATIVRLARARAELDGVSPEKLALLEDIVGTCRERNIRLVLLITPNHALFQLAFPELGNPDPFFLRDRTTILSTIGAPASAGTRNPSHPSIELWDFLDAHPINCEPLPPEDEPTAHMRNWPDLFHVTGEIGDLMLNRINGMDGDYGIRLTEPAQLDKRIKAIETGLSTYASRNPGDLEFLRESLARFEER